MSAPWTPLDSDAAREIIAERREKAMEMKAIADAYPPGHAARHAYVASAEYAATTAILLQKAVDAFGAQPAAVH